MDTLRVDQIRAFLVSGTRASKEIQLRLDISQASVSRGISQLGAEVLVLGRGPATRYALVRNVRDLGHDFPIYRIDAVPGDALQVEAV